MLDRFLDGLTGRRLGGALFVLAGIVVAIAVLQSRDDGGARTPRVQPVRIVSVPQLGLTFAYPSTWSRDVSGRVIRISAPRRAAIMTFASPVAGRQDERVKAAAIAALRRRFAPAKVVAQRPARLGARKVASFELRGGAKGDVRVLALVGSSRYRTYVVTLITPARPSAAALAEAREILATVRLPKPRLASKG